MFKSYIVRLADNVLGNLIAAVVMIAITWILGLLFDFAGPPLLVVILAVAALTLIILNEISRRAHIKELPVAERKRRRTFLTVSALTVVGLMVGAVWVTPRIEALWRRLTDDSDPRLPILPPREVKGGGFKEKADYAQIVIGGLTLMKNMAALRMKPAELFDGWGGLIAFVKDDTVFVNVRLEYGAAPVVAIRLTGDDFTVHMPRWDKNYKEGIALEVVDQDRLPMFQLIRRGPTIVELYGLFEVPGKGLSVAGERDLVVGATDKRLIARTRPRRLFKYPSAQYPGEFESD